MKMKLVGKRRVTREKEEQSLRVRKDHAEFTDWERWRMESKDWKERLDSDHAS